MSEPSLFVAPSTGRQPASAPRQHVAAPGGQLQLDLAIGGLQNGSQRPAPRPQSGNPGENGAQATPRTPSGQRSRKAPDAPLANFAAAERLSGPRPWGKARTAPDEPSQAVAPAGCQCARPLPQRDELEMRCTKCGRPA